MMRWVRRGVRRYTGNVSAPQTLMAVLCKARKLTTLHCDLRTVYFLVLVRLAVGSIEAKAACRFALVLPRGCSISGATSGSNLSCASCFGPCSFFAVTSFLTFFLASDFGADSRSTWAANTTA